MKTISLVNIILGLNLVLIILGCILPNELLMHHSYVLYGVQFLAIIPCILPRLIYIKNLFLPTFFTLLYYSVNLILGSYLVPRYFGWNKEFTSNILAVNSYNYIVPYFLMTNLVLFLLSYSAFGKLNDYTHDIPRKIEGPRLGTYIDYARLIIASSLFVAISYFNIYMLFAFQLAILVILLSYIAYYRKRYRYYAYAAFLFLMVLFNYEDKREIIIVLFLIVFIEAYHGRWLIQFTAKKVLYYISWIALFMFLIMTSSILRGYGQFDVSSLPVAVSYVPKYVLSDIFIDGLIENLELNYSYGTAVTSMDMILKGELKYQYGLTIMKVLFLPITRDIFPEKPESIMQQFTRVYNPSYWAEGGSLPVIFPCDMFLNFSYFGVLPFAFVWLVINYTFMKFHHITKRNMMYFSFIFLFSTVLMFARGSGLELYLLYCIFAIPVFALHIFLKYIIENSRYVKRIPAHVR